MDDFVLAFAQPVAAVWGIFILLLVFAYKKGVSFTNKERNNFSGILIISVVVLGWFVFFKDLDFVFDCRKETQRCDYYHSTIYNKKLRQVRSYDLTGIKEVEIKTHIRHTGKHTTKTVYRLEFKGENGRFEMPNDFDFKEDAQKQARRASVFLQTDKPYYVYKDMTPKGSDKVLFIIITLSLSMFFAIVGILTLLVKIFKKE